MANLLKKFTLAGALAATALVASAPAQAQEYYDNRGSTGTAVAAGVIGLAVGALLGSSGQRNRSYDRRYRDYPSYDSRGYPIDRGYQNNNYPAYPNYNNRGYSNYNNRGYPNYNDQAHSNYNYNDRSYRYGGSYGNQGQRHNRRH